MPVDIAVDENGAINAIISTPRATVEVIANVVRSENTVQLNEVHVELLSGGPLDRQCIQLLLGEVCRHYHVENLIVQGARRTSGRSAGKIPRALKYRVSK